MVNIIWLFFIVISFVAAIVNGRMEALTEAAFEGAKSGVSVSFGLISIMVFWLGLMRVGEDAGLLRKIAVLLQPAVRFLFPECTKGSSSTWIYNEQHEREHTWTRQCGDSNGH